MKTIVYCSFDETIIDGTRTFLLGCSAICASQITCNWLTVAAVDVMCIILLLYSRVRNFRVWIQSGVSVQPNVGVGVDTCDCLSTVDNPHDLLHAFIEFTR